MIIIPKKISDNEIEKFFNKKGFSNLVKQKGEELENWIDRRRHKLTHPPRLRHLYMIYQTIILNKRTTVLEFGTGISTLVMARALLENKKKFGPKNLSRDVNFPFNYLQ